MLSEDGWRVCLAGSRLSSASAAGDGWRDLEEAWAGWFAGCGLPERTPYLLDPDFGYDLQLNAFFQSVEMLVSAWNTQVSYARDLGLFLSFLWSARSRRRWQDATTADHLAYFGWRCRDERGPRVSASTWNREVAAVNRFYAWQVEAGHTRSQPIPHRPVRGFRGGYGRDVGVTRPATYAHGAAAEKVQWLPTRDYRLWRDVGVRGYTPRGLPDPRFRGRWASRNAAFCDLLVRTGLRLSEQAWLTVFDVPSGNYVGYRRFWLPAEISKGGSARWVYVPGRLVSELDSYRRIDRAQVVADAQRAGRYTRERDWLVVEDPDVAVARARGGARIKVDLLSGWERSRLLVERAGRLEPAALWLTERGEAVAPSSWQAIFRGANIRCAAAGVVVRAHPHMLRHTFAVVTLEQLQRGHIRALGALSVEQRGHYVRVFGDPLDWVRRRLGHRSVVTTQIYLHALQELEMNTRIALIADDEDLAAFVEAER